MYDIDREPKGPTRACMLEHIKRKEGSSDTSQHSKMRIVEFLGKVYIVVVNITGMAVLLLSTIGILLLGIAWLLGIRLPAGTSTFVEDIRFVLMIGFFVLFGGAILIGFYRIGSQISYARKCKKEYEEHRKRKPF